MSRTRFWIGLFVAVLIIALTMPLMAGCRTELDSSRTPGDDATSGKASDADSQAPTFKLNLDEGPRPVSAPDDAWPLSRGDTLAGGIAGSSLPDEPELLWKVTTEKGWYETTPVIADGTVFIGSTNGFMYALALEDGEELWKFETHLGFSGAASYKEGRLYAGDYDGVFYCWNAESGEKLWTFDSEAEVTQGCNFHGENLVFGSTDGYLYCLNAKSGDLVWKWLSEDQIQCFPTIVEDRAFVAGCDGRLHIIDLEKGEERGTVELGAPTGGSPAVLGNFLFVGTEGMELLAIDWKEERTAWSYRSPGRRQGSFWGGAAITDDVLYIGSLDQRLHAVNPADGSPIWTFPTQGDIEGSPVLVGERIFFGSNDGSVYAVDCESGNASWQYETNGRLLASPAVADERLVIADDDGTVYCFGEK
jgi:outer membrane protein assembly factor BamB